MVNGACGGHWAEQRKWHRPWHAELSSQSLSLVMSYKSQHPKRPRGPLWRCFWIPPVGSRNWLGSCRGFSSYNQAHGHSWLRPSLSGWQGFPGMRRAAPQQGSEKSSYLICGPKTGWGTSENQRQVLQKGGGGTTGAFQPGREGHGGGLIFRAGVS